MMASLLSLDPWGWMMMMCFFVALPCALLGAFLILRRMSLVGDAISHSALPGIVVAFAFVGDLSSPWLLVGAAFAGVLVTFLIEQIHRRTRIKQDSAIGIAFTSLFALGLVLIRFLIGDKVHLDQDCVLEGNVSHVAYTKTIDFMGFDVPDSIFPAVVVAIITVILIVIFYRILTLSSFDAGLAASFGYKPGTVHYALMAVLSVVVVSAFEAVGAILVIALLVLPGATAYLCTHRLKLMLVLSAIHALISSIAGIYISVAFNGKESAGVVIAGTILFLIAWMFGPADGVIMKAIHRRKKSLEGSSDFK
ncbi:MAG: metal ABC transporter permease [Akkermansiaceae bacterium]